MDNPSIHPPDPDQFPGDDTEVNAENSGAAQNEPQAAVEPALPPEGVPASESAPAQPQAEAQPQKAPARGFWHFLLGADTRLGRFNRAALRFLATVLGLFALGLLAGYLILYRPTQQELTRVRADLAQTNQRLDGMQNDLNSAKQAQADLAKTNQDLQKQTDAANQHALLLQAMNQANLARLALAKNDTAGAQEALKNAPSFLIKLDPSISAQNADLIKTIQTRLNLALTEIQTDPKIAASDLGILNDQFVDLEKKMESGQ